MTLPEELDAEVTAAVAEGEYASKQSSRGERPTP
jgi:Arc/MetJ-type ribon-helix-helix transcriptional regulator